MNIKQGQIVKILPEFLDTNESNTVYIAAENYNGGDTILISDRDCTMSIVPTELIRINMIEEYE